MAQQSWDKIVAEWRGKDSVEAEKVVQQKNGKFRLFYKDNGKRDYIELDSRRELDQALLEFGGKNDFTVRAPDEFLKLNGWDSEYLFNLGHTCTKIRIRGLKRLRNRRLPVEIPGDCGYPDTIDKQKKSPKDMLHIKEAYEEGVDVTRTFKNRESFDNFIKFIFSHELLTGFEWSVHVLGTYSEDTQKHCVWRRTKAGDGTSRMVLELFKLDSLHYNECLPFDIISAADGLIGGECRKISVRKIEPKNQLLCEIHARENVDPNTVEAAQ